MATSETTIIVTVFAIVIIVGVIFAPPLIRSGVDALRDLFSDFRDIFFEDFLNSNASSGGYSSIGLKITYQDGTSKDINLKDFSLFPLSIIDDGGVVKFVLVYVRTTIEHSISNSPRYVYEVTDFDATFHNIDTGGSVPILENEYRIEDQTTWTSGESKDIGITTWGASELDGFLSTHEGEIGTGNIKLKMSADVSVKVYYDATTFDQETGSTTSTWTFQWDKEEITSLNVMIGTDVLH